MSFCLVCCLSFVIWGYYIHEPPRSICIHLFVAQIMHIYIRTYLHVYNLYRYIAYHPEKQRSTWNCTIKFTDIVVPKFFKDLGTQ